MSLMERTQARDTRVLQEDNTTIRRGSGDFLRDQGVEDPDEFRVKAHLSHDISSAIQAHGLSQDAVASITGLAQSDVSRIVNGRLDDYSVWRLIKTLGLLGTDIVIGTAPSAGREPGVIMVQKLEDASLQPEDDCSSAPSF